MDDASGEAYPFPEVTRALRVFGTRRGRPGSDHDRFFAPLLDPLRAAREHLSRGTGRPWQAAALVDAARAADGVRGALDAMAVDHGGPRAADRRALGAELEECAAPLLAALDALGGAAGALAAAGDAGRPAAWGAWTAALTDAFAAADRAWEGMLPALADPRGGAGRMWRRVLRGGHVIGGGLPPHRRS